MANKESKTPIIKPSLPRGIREFSPAELALREDLFNSIRDVYRRYGFIRLETPVLEQLSVLTGKYGEEGSKLLFQVLNNGEYLKQVSAEELAAANYGAITPKITEKALRYDLTVPLARYVVMNRDKLAFPFRRYQIDKVWRADRPARGRYREFYQCDADTIGSYSQLYDAECLMMMSEIVEQLSQKYGLGDFTIQLNNRKILLGLAEVWGFTDNFDRFAIAIDKWDKVGEDAVIRELGQNGFSETQIHSIQRLSRLNFGSENNEARLNTLESWFSGNETGSRGVAELREVLVAASISEAAARAISIRPLLARGLDYYTGSIFECTFNAREMGSVASGGRYDELTAGFGLKNMPGVGMSIGVERLYDLITAGDFSAANPAPARVLVANFGNDLAVDAWKLTAQLRMGGIAAEMYADPVKLGRQLQYADKLGIPFVALIGEEEKAADTVKIKDMQAGSERVVSRKDIIQRL